MRNVINNLKFRPFGKEESTSKAKQQGCREANRGPQQAFVWLTILWRKLIANDIILGGLTQNSGISAFFFFFFLQKAAFAMLSQPSHTATMGRGRVAAALLQSSPVCPFTPWSASGPHVTWLVAGASRLDTRYKESTQSKLDRDSEETISWTKAIAFVYCIPPASTSKMKAWYRSGLFTDKGQVSI